MRSGVIKRMVCVDCAMRINATLRQAKAHGWLLWVGGALCKSCRAKLATDGDGEKEGT